MNPVIADLAARRDWADHHDDADHDGWHALCWTAVQLLAAQAALRGAPVATRTRAAALVARAKALPPRMVTPALVLAVGALTTRAALRAADLDIDSSLTMAEAAIAAAGLSRGGRVQ